jgi:hypothetical protein
MRVDCMTCKLLSEEFTEATKAHFSILGKSQLAQTEHNSVLFNELESLKLTAAERRNKARLELRQHEASHLVEVVKPPVQRDA